MAGICKRPKLELPEDEEEKLRKISQSRTYPLREVQRAEILLKYSVGEPILKIKKDLNVSRPTIYQCIDRAIAAGVDTGLKDKYHRAFDPVITKEAKAWVTNLACTKPKDLGYAAEMWTLSSLAKHTRNYAPKEGHSCLKKAAKATIQRILKSDPVKPHKIRYYLERRDPMFNEKMKNVLMVYKEVSTQNSTNPENVKKITTVSVDEKLRVQAIKNIAPDLPPKPGEYPETARDYEYKRLGTLSILASLDLHDGHIIAQVHDRHRSKEFISLLKDIDSYYNKDYKIRIILDNHSSHVSKETMAYLKTVPNFVL